MSQRNKRKKKKRKIDAACEDHHSSQGVKTTNSDEHDADDGSFEEEERAQKENLDSFRVAVVEVTDPHVQMPFAHSEMNRCVRAKGNADATGVEGVHTKKGSLSSVMNPSVLRNDRFVDRMYHYGFTAVDGWDPLPLPFASLGRARLESDLIQLSEDELRSFYAQFCSKKGVFPKKTELVNQLTTLFFDGRVQTSPILEMGVAQPDPIVMRIKTREEGAVKTSVFSPSVDVMKLILQSFGYGTDMLSSIGVVRWNWRELVLSTWTGSVHVSDKNLRKIPWLILRVAKHVIVPCFDSYFVTGLAQTKLVHLTLDTNYSNVSPFFDSLLRHTGSTHVPFVALRTLEFIIPRNSVIIHHRWPDVARICPNVDTLVHPPTFEGFSGLKLRKVHLNVTSPLDKMNRRWGKENFWPKGAKLRVVSLGPEAPMRGEPVVRWFPAFCTWLKLDGNWRRLREFRVAIPSGLWESARDKLLSKTFKFKCLHICSESFKNLSKICRRFRRDRKLREIRLIGGAVDDTILAANASLASDSGHLLQKISLRGKLQQREGTLLQLTEFFEAILEKRVPYVRIDDEVSVLTVIDGRVAISPCMKAAVAQATVLSAFLLVLKKHPMEEMMLITIGCRSSPEDSKEESCFADAVEGPCRFLEDGRYAPVKKRLKELYPASVGILQIGSQETVPRRWVRSLAMLQGFFLQTADNLPKR